MTAPLINIFAKSCDESFTVLLRDNELVKNLRALVAVRIKESIINILMVFGGQVLSDEGTIDEIGITAGVTVHVLCRKPIPQPLSCPLPGSNYLERSKKGGNGNVTAFWNRWLPSEPAVLRDILQYDKKFNRLLDDHPQYRFFLSSDRNVRELLDCARSPAKLQEMSRLRELSAMRLELLPGGPRLLSRLNEHLQAMQEWKVASIYQWTRSTTKSGDNPQRGLENKLPLPNAWAVKPMKKAFRLYMRKIQVMKDEKPVARFQLRLTFDFRRILERQMSLTEEDLKSMESSLASLAEAAVSRLPSQFHSKLVQLEEQGRTDRSRNIYALIICRGNIDGAIKLLERWDKPKN